MTYDWRTDMNRVARSTCLSGICTKAGHIKDDAADLARYVRMLESLPGYETEAEELASQAVDALTESLLVAKLALVELKKKRAQLIAVGWE